MEVVSLLEAAEAAELVSMGGDRRCIKGLSMIWASGEQNVVSLALGLRLTVEVGEAIIIFGGC